MFIVAGLVFLTTVHRIQRNCHSWLARQNQTSRTYFRMMWPKWALIARKSDCVECDKQRRRPACTCAKSSQLICSLLPGIIVQHGTASFLDTGLCRLVGTFEHTFNKDANADDRFSRVMWLE